VEVLLSEMPKIHRIHFDDDPMQSIGALDFPDAHEEKD
jgi:hypothetical protein